MNKEKCEIEGCERFVRSKNMCAMHYHRKYRGVTNLDPNSLYQSKEGTCKIDMCNRSIFAKGFCSMHYNRIKRNESDMRVDPLIGGPIKLSNTKCTMPNCINIQYAKGYCHKHYELNRRNGVPYKIVKAKLPCKANGCFKKAKIKGFCAFHYSRYVLNIDFNRPKGLKGELNPNWNGGVSEYPDHHQMKKNRLTVLRNSNYICIYCGDTASEVHHKDLSKDNHSMDNLVACCHKCNQRMKKPYTSKYIRIYGKNLDGLVEELGRSKPWIMNKHKSGELHNLL